ncbi:MAG: NAD-dependent epimerase/dehydratase family protein, partial [Candidatus Aminicenantaceae bacterium]
FVRIFLHLPKFFMEKDINHLDLPALLKKVDVIFHLAAQAGVRSSWGRKFSDYTWNNIESTQKILEACRADPVKKLVYASSSSVYGDCPDLPMREASSLFPYSPYGVTKLAGEHLCSLYFRNYGIPAVSLRFFTVYGPGQRPDMAFHKFFKSAAENKPVSVYGSGEQTRDFTYIDDIVEANLAAMGKGKPGEVYNIGGGHNWKIKDIFPLLNEVTGRKIKINHIEKQKGDVAHTSADISKAKADLGYNPQTPLEEGLREEWIWLRHLYSY